MTKASLVCGAIPSKGEYAEGAARCVGIPAQAARPAPAAATPTNARRDKRDTSTSSKESVFMAAHANVTAPARLARRRAGTLRMRHAWIGICALFITAVHAGTGAQ